MVRVKRGIIKHKKRERLFAQTKGFLWRRKSTRKAAKEATVHSYRKAFEGRKKKKGDFRRLWQIKINAASRAQGLSYSALVPLLKKAGVVIDRKILADLADKNPSIFAKIVEEAQQR